MNGTVRGAAAAARPRGATVGHLATGVVLPVVAAAVALAGLRVPVPGGVSVLDGMAVGLVLIWALAGAICARAPDRAPQWPLTLGTLAAAVALTAARLASQPPAGQHQLARAGATLAAALVIACSCHFLLASPAAGWAAGHGAQAPEPLTSRRWAPDWRSRSPAGHCHRWWWRWGWWPPSGAPCPPSGSGTCAQRPGTGSGCSGSPSAWSWPRTRPWSS